MKPSGSSANDVVEIKSNWNMLWWLVGSIFIPISVPYIFLNIIGQLNLRKNKDSLPGKVILFYY